MSRSHTGSSVWKRATRKSTNVRRRAGCRRLAGQSACSEIGRASWSGRTRARAPLRSSGPQTKVGSSVMPPPAMAVLRVLEARGVSRNFGGLRAVRNVTPTVVTGAVNDAYLQAECSTPQPGLMMVRCTGTRRFEVTRSEKLKHGLWIADVTLRPDDQPVAIPPDLAHVAQALNALIQSLHQRAVPAPEMPVQAPYLLDDCACVANRWCELLPIPAEHKQRLTELGNPLLRLDPQANRLSTELTLRGAGLIGATILVKEPTLLGKRFVLEEDVTRVGRGADNQIVLDGDSVSRRHAQFRQKGDVWVIVGCAAGGVVFSTPYGDRGWESPLTTEAFTKRLVSLHGGELGIVSEPGKGSTFSLTFPVAERDAA